MDSKELLLACRSGDLVKLQYLVEQREADLNIRDKWDSTPLYYACICGHEDVVKYLLDNGAKCEANTFDGERCVYGALTPSIKKMLKTYNQVTSHTVRRDIYYEFLRRQLERSPHSDLTFVVHGTAFRAHRCILSARSSYFADMLRTKWGDRDTVMLTHQLVTPKAFEAVLQYLYTSRLEAHVDDIMDILRLAKQCHLTHLLEEVDKKLKTVVEFEMSKPGVNVTMICIEPDASDRTLQQDLSQLADLALPTNAHIQELPFPSQEVQLFGDMYFSVEDHKFLCHQVFFCERTDYFKALLEDHFGEASSEGGLPVLFIHGVSPNVFVQVLYYMYQDAADMLTDQNVFDVLCAADMFLLPGLKRQCANVIAQYIDADNVINILRGARTYQLPRLEDQCASFIASNIFKVVGQPEFAQFIQEDAAEVKGREETDSIPIIDDIRSHITDFVETYSDLYEADSKLAAIDRLLVELDLDA